ncbi:MAG TPA: carboxylesterase family protein [Caulobacteraceae bacterium]
MNYTPLLLALTLVAAPTLAQTVRTEGGVLRGTTTADGLAVYKAIPFAAPPVGALRWRPPAPAAPWAGVRAADAFAPACMQVSAAYLDFGIPALPVSEDCLYLNVWTPAKTKAERLPVMVWIQGGAFVSGGAAIPLYSGEHLARRGVVVVSLAYRLGAFGLLASPELSAEERGASGNWGLMDQVAALKWVKRNIAAFGGDPHRVTVFGESAGAIAVSMLAASPAARGLFQRAISQSGGSFAPPKRDKEGGTNVLPLRVAEARGAAFLKSLGAADLAAARRVPAEAVLKAAEKQAGGEFWPTIDGRVIVGDQYRLYEAGKYNVTPVLIGTNADEGALFVPAVKAADYQARVRAGFGDWADRILAAYPGATDAQALRSERDLFRETAFAWHTWAWARLQAQRTSSSGRGAVFIYDFAHRPPYPNPAFTHDWGAAHAAEIPYVFGTFEAQPFMAAAGAADRALSDQMQAYWVNFARTGDPNGPGLPRWPAYTAAAPEEMHFDGELKAGPVSNLDKLKVIDGYYAWLRGQGRRGEVADPPPGLSAVLPPAGGENAGASPPPQGEGDREAVEGASAALNRRDAEAQRTQSSARPPPHSTVMADRSPPA